MENMVEIADNIWKKEKTDDNSTLSKELKIFSDKYRKLIWRIKIIYMCGVISGAHYERTKKYETNT